ncbi:MAG TPA: hypothetical protein PLY49_12530, partial [Opitutaceae bacterium]|nr:hypothetical protein [Opitutaceae bacterium]
MSDTTPNSSHRCFNASQRVYLTGSRPDLRVPMREIALTATRDAHGVERPNAP